MVKGKKKDPKKKETGVEESLASLSVRDDEPSTSSRKASIPSDEAVGLTGKARKKKEKEAKLAAKLGAEASSVQEPEVVTATQEAEASSVPEPKVVTSAKPVAEVASVEPTSEKKQEDDDDQGGLGVPSTRRKRPPRKKKSMASQEAAGDVPTQPVQQTPKVPTEVKSMEVKTTENKPIPESGTGVQVQQITPPTHAPWAKNVPPVNIQQVPWQKTQPAPAVERGPPLPVKGPWQQVPTAANSGHRDLSLKTPVPQVSREQIQPSAPGMRQGQTPRTPSETVMCRYKIPAKILGHSVRGTNIQVLTNYLPMRLEPFKIHRYDVAISPDKPKKLIVKAFQTAKAKEFNKYLIAFDQMKNCYSKEPLPKVTQNARHSVMVEVLDNNGRALPFEVSFKKTGVIDFAALMQYMADKQCTSLNPPTEAIQCIDVILRQGTLENYIKAGRQFFKRPDNPIDLGDGLEMWTGLFQSAIFQARSFINIDVAHKGFPRNQPLIDAIVRDFRLDPSRNLNQQRGRGLELFASFIKGLRVIARIGGDSSANGKKREYICNDFVETPYEMTFEAKGPDGKTKKITVYDYFIKEKGIRLKYPNLNCMWVGPRDRKIYYPIELLDVAYGQALNKQLNETQLSKMVREAATKPEERKRKIEEVIRDMNYSRNSYFKHFGLHIDTEFLKVNAKVLDAPKLDTGGGQNVSPSIGAWKANRLLKPEALDAWGFIGLEIDYNYSNAEKVIKLMISVGQRVGMRITEPSFKLFNVRIQELHNVFHTALSKKLKFLVIVINTRGRNNKDNYHKIKKMAEREVGILTQCIKDTTASGSRMDEQTIRNILLKVNSKLMGINQILHAESVPKCLQGGKVMVVGADVTHPSPDQTSVPSIAAVTASIDPHCFIYNIQLSVQTPKKEVIVEFEDMMVEHLQVYRQRQGSLPIKIFVFRDGVSEGQFAEVMNSELQAVHNAYARLAGQNARVEVLFLLVQKRHHTRFFQSGRYINNVLPGTVVDQEIVHQRELDFYLVSHQAIKGTARPTRYHAVCNDGNIPHDEVEQLTYYLCHLYSRCTRSVSYPTPTYYAHLACLRARSLTHGDHFNNADLERRPQRLKVLDKILETSRMFFV